ncbi:MAG: nitrilase family protein [Muribaculaceae bacterium]|nr:nitrilase family protein [Muribaculaceae bacterium]MDE5844833.1 nitrilase family protein [Muribaculaceae bacterium]MDE5856844.1 nitrilase family protein [Muribaculaceae bacterium]
MNLDSLKITIIPLDIKQADPDTNIRQIEQLVSLCGVGKSNIIVLPELFSTGFIADKNEVVKYAQPIDGDVLNSIRQLSKKTGAAFSGSFLCNDNNQFFNRAFFIEPDGNETYYDKHHLFSISSESRILTGGNQQSPIINYMGWNITMVICYDIRFPVWCRNVNQQFDIMLIPANWPNARKYAWEHLLISRAIENQCYVVGANRSGDDDYGNYDNLSFIFDPWGKPCGRIDPTSKLVSACVDREFINDVRRRLPVINDADSFKLDI